MTRISEPHFDHFFGQSEGHFPTTAKFDEVVVAVLHLIHQSGITVHETEEGELAHVVVATGDFEGSGAAHPIDAIAKLFRIHWEVAVPAEKPIGTGPKLLLVDGLIPTHYSLKKRDDLLVGERHDRMYCLGIGGRINIVCFNSTVITLCDVAIDKHHTAWLFPEI